MSHRVGTEVNFIHPYFSFPMPSSHLMSKESAKVGGAMVAHEAAENEVIKTRIEIKIFVVLKTNNVPA